MAISKSQEVKNQIETYKHLITFNGHNVKEERLTGMISLTDLWKASGQTKNQSPNDWLRLPGTKKFIDVLAKRITGLSRDLTKSSGRSGTYAHWQIGLAYAKYLSPELHMHVNEIYMRYRSNDVSLAEEISDNASKENREWLAKRLLGKLKRNEFTDTLKEHGVEGKGYPICTNDIYLGLWEKDALALKREQSKGGIVVTNPRDHFNTDELVTVMFAEVAAKKDIEKNDWNGNQACM